MNAMLHGRRYLLLQLRLVAAKACHKRPMRAAQRGCLRSPAQQTRRRRSGPRLHVRREAARARHAVLPFRWQALDCRWQRHMACRSPRGTQCRRRHRLDAMTLVMTRVVHRKGLQRSQPWSKQPPKPRPPPQLRCRRRRRQPPPRQQPATGDRLRPLPALARRRARACCRSRRALPSRRLLSIHQTASLPWLNSGRSVQPLPTPPPFACNRLRYWPRLVCRRGREGCGGGPLRTQHASTRSWCSSSATGGRRSAR